MEQEGMIKSIVATSCPKCKEHIYVEIASSPAVMGSIFTKEDASDAKAEVMRKIKDLHLTKEQISGAVDWITDPGTVFSPQEVPMILKSLQE